MVSAEAPVAVARSQGPIRLSCDTTFSARRFGLGSLETGFCEDFRVAYMPSHYSRSLALMHQANPDSSQARLPQPIMAIALPQLSSAYHVGIPGALFSTYRELCPLPASFVCIQCAYPSATDKTEDPITVGGLPRGKKAVQSVRQQSVMCVVML